jgi:hypothetical protein
MFHGGGDFIVKYMFTGMDAGFLEACHERRVGSGEFGIRSVLDGFDKDGAGVDFDHDHDIVVSGL